MVNYQNGKVYKIINENNEIIYIGSTAQELLCDRYKTHKYKAPSHRIILIENYACNSKQELYMKEQQIIEEHSDLLNKYKAYQSKENRKEYKKEYHKQYQKEYYQYNKEKISDIQQIWIKESLPSNVNKKILIDKMVEWESTHRVLESYNNEFHATGKIFQSSHFNALFKVILSVFPLVLSVNVLNGISLEDFSAENPMIYLTLIVYLIIFIVVIVFTYSLLRPSLERLLCHIDGHKSKGAYRFNIFNSMLSNHVTIKELNDS